jgi:fluoride ion exporter CrcB/FEX
MTALVSLGGLAFGLHLSTHIHFNPPSFKPNLVGAKVIGLISLLAYLATIPLYFKLSPRFRISTTSALLFSFPGTLTRHLLGTYMNPLKANLPFGTLGANSLGTGLLAAFHVIQRTPVTPAACAILQGLIDGYCGCLTTISTFAVEIRGLKSWNAWRYFALSYIVGQALMVAIIGGSWWSGRVKEHAMCSGPV